MSEGKEITKRFLEEREKTFRGGRRVGGVHVEKIHKNFKTSFPLVCWLQCQNELHWQLYCHKRDFDIDGGRD